MTRRDTAARFPSTDYGARIDALGDQYRRLAMYGDALKREREKEAFELATFNMDPGLIFEGQKQKMLEMLEKFTDTNSKVFEEKGNRLSLKDKMDMQSRKNLLGQWQGQMLASNEVYKESLKLFQQHPELYDPNEWNKSVEQLKGGEPVQRFLYPRPKEVYSTLEAYASDAADRKITIEREQDGITTTSEYEVISNWNDQKYQDFVSGLMIEDPGFAAGVGLQYQDQPVHTKEKYPTPAQWMLNDTKAKKIFQQRFGGGYEEKPTKESGAGVPKVREIFPDADGYYDYSGATRKGEGPIKYQSPVGDGYMLDGTKVTGVGAIDDAIVIGSHSRWKNPETGEVQDVTFVSIPKMTQPERDKVTFKDENGEEVTFVLPATEKAKVDPINRDVVIVPRSKTQRVEDTYFKRVEYTETQEEFKNLMEEIQ